MGWFSSDTPADASTADSKSENTSWFSSKSKDKTADSTSGDSGWFSSKSKDKTADSKSENTSWFSSKSKGKPASSKPTPGSLTTTSLYNKVQYLISKNVSDPEADAYARQQAEQAKQDAEKKEREDKAAADKAEADAKAAKEAEKAKALAARSRFDYKELISESAKTVLATFLSILLTLFLLYGGHLAANQAIGYKVPFRIMSFIYGAIGAIYIIPMSLYKVYGKGETLPYYSFLPISTYVPNGTLEEIFLGGFCYQEDEASVAARSAVETLYSDAFKKSQAT